LWSVQQAALLHLLSGASLRKNAQTSGRARSTVRRWWQWLQQRHEQLAFHLRSHWPGWGRAGSWQGFWQLALAQEPLREVMGWLDRQGIVVP